MTIELTLLSRVAYRDHEITSPSLQQLLAALAIDLPVGASTRRLIDELWPEQQPANPTKALQVLVSRARSLLGHDVVASTATGYRLAVNPAVVDVHAATTAARSGIQSADRGDHQQSLDLVEAALALWDGAASDPDAVGPLAELHTRLADTRRTLQRSQALALSRLGRAGEAVDRLRTLAAAHPRDEEILEQLLRCLAALDAPASALQEYERYRRRLRDDLGADPGQSLQDLHVELLAGQAPAVRHGLAFDPNPLLGRDSDVRAVVELTRTSRVTSIIGPGGLGKTRMAHVVGRSVPQRTVHFVGLAGVSSGDAVVSEVAASLGVRASRPRLSQARFDPPSDVLSGIVESLAPGPALLILDNCEHVVESAADLVQSLISRSPDLRVLTTSRAPLGISSESVYLLPELDLPTSIELFESRARAARPEVDLPADAVRRLCTQLDGLPLAVELAAARTKVMTVPQLEQRLKHRFSLLRGGARDAPERHRTLEAVIEWSWQLLDPGEQQALQSLSVFPDGFCLEAAETVLGAAADTVGVLAQLIDQSLLKVVPTRGSGRYRMLETVREFAAQRLATADAPYDTDQAQRAYLQWAKQFSRDWHPEQLFAADTLGATTAVRTEQDNLVGALQLALVRDDISTAATAYSALSMLWTIESNHPQAVALAPEVTAGLSHYRPAPDEVEIVRTALVLALVNCLIFNQITSARALIALRRLPAVPVDSTVRALADILLALRSLSTPDSTVLAERQASANPYIAVIGGSLAAQLWENEGRPEDALAAAEMVVERMPADCGPWLLASARNQVGALRLHVGRPADRDHDLWETLNLFERIGSWNDAAEVRWSLVFARLHRGDLAGAEAMLDGVSGLPPEDTYGFRVREIGVRAELELARQRVEPGLRLWRQAAEQVTDLRSGFFTSSPSGLEPWTMVTQSSSVIAHVRHGRPDLVTELAGTLRSKVLLILRRAGELNSPVGGADGIVAFLDYPVCGVTLLACGLMLLGGRADRDADDDPATVGVPDTVEAAADPAPPETDEQRIRRGVRLLAIARAFHYSRAQPTVALADSSVADSYGPEYDALVASYSGLRRQELRQAAIALLAPGAAESESA